MNVSQGARALLYESGIEHRFWSQAMAFSCFLSNVSRAREKAGLTPWQTHHGRDKCFKGKLAPTGVKIHCLPTADREVLQRQVVAAQMVEGMLT